jgi:hypothetical protein
MEGRAGGGRERRIRRLAHAEMLQGGSGQASSQRAS